MKTISVKEWYLFEQKGGPGSGNFGHSGREGQVGGSREGSGVFAPGSITEEKIDQIHTDIKSWEGDRRDVAFQAAKDTEDAHMVLSFNQGKLKGIASVFEEKDAMHLSRLATAERGFGESIMNKVFSLAAEKQKGVQLWALPEAEGFYEKIGMKKQKGFFILSLQDIQGRFKSLSEDLSRLEPEDGIFCNGLSLEKSFGLGSILKGGSGSGNFGHAGRPGEVGGSGEGTGSGADVSKYSKDADQISHAQRMAQADISDISRQMQKNLSEIQGAAPDHTDIDGNLSKDNAGIIRNNLNQELQSYSNYLAGDTALRARDYIDQFHKAVYQGIEDGSLKGVKAKDIDALGLDSVRKMIYQEVESNRQAFTDHGIRHIEGDVARALKLASIMNPNLTGKEALMINFAMVNHDIGYTVPLIREGGLRGVKITQDHPEFSAKIAGQQESQWDKGKIFSKEEYNKITEGIRTHDSTSVKDGNFLTAIRVSDNLSLFNEEKLPSMFRYVAGGDNVLIRMGMAAKKNNQKTFDSLRSELHSKIDKANINENLKRDLKAATKEITYMTPKFTLGVLAGGISNIKKSSGGIDITVKHNAYDAKMQKMFDMGQKQTKKFLGDYSITDYSKTEYDIGGSIRLKVEGYSGSGPKLGALPKRIGLGTIIKGGSGSGNFGHSGREGRVGGSDDSISDRSSMLDYDKNAKLPRHIASLRVPPAWRNVKYNPDPKAALLVKGVDIKDRPQSIYSAKFKEQNAHVKFSRVNELAKKFDRIKQENDNNTRSGDLLTKEAASCMQLIMHTGIRPGSESDTGAKQKAYGATTLEGRHVITDGDKTRLDFIGKKGVALSIPIEDKKIASQLQVRAKKAGQNGQLFGIDEKQLLSYAHSLDGGKFKTKDFRTLLGTKTAADKISAYGKRLPRSQKEYKKMVKEVATTVSKKLGNTPTIALQSYINPTVFSKWQGEF